MADTKQPYLAVLIDTENVLPKHAPAIFNQIKELGDVGMPVLVGRADKQKRWARALSRLQVFPLQQIATSGTSSAVDVALCTQAMDMLHTRRFDGFCIVSSESDFSSLAIRIKEQGLPAYGIGLENAPDEYRKLCTLFTVLQVEEPDEAPQDAEVPAPESTPEETQETTEQEPADNIDWVSLSVLGKQLTDADPEFDPKAFGKESLSDLLEETGKYMVDRENGRARLKLV